MVVLGRSESVGPMQRFGVKTFFWAFFGRFVAFLGFFLLFHFHLFFTFQKDVQRGAESFLSRKMLAFSHRAFKANAGKLFCALAFQDAEKIFCALAFYAKYYAGKIFCA